MSIGLMPTPIKNQNQLAFNLKTLNKFELSFDYSSVPEILCIVPNDFDDFAEEEIPPKLFFFFFDIEEPFQGRATLDPSLQGKPRIHAITHKPHVSGQPERCQRELNPGPLSLQLIPSANLKPYIVHYFVKIMCSKCKFHFRMDRSCLDENEAFLTTADSAVKLLPEATKPVTEWKGLEYRSTFPILKPPGANFYPPDMDKMVWMGSFMSYFKKYSFA